MSDFRLRNGNTMVYYRLMFAAAFLPLIMLIYSILPKKYRWTALLAASVCFYSTFSVKRLLFPVAATVITYWAGLALEKTDAKMKASLKEAGAKEGATKEEIKAQKAALRSSFMKKSKAVLTLGILGLLLLLLGIKYTDFFLENINGLLAAAGSDNRFAMRNFLLPLGISFYTLQAIGYLVDVYWKKVPAQKNPFRLGLFLLFFPTIIEGPITPYAEVEKSLYAGEKINPDHVFCGYFRLGLGVVKKLVIADRLYPVVTDLYGRGDTICGMQVVMAAVLFTVMEYMDFSGCIDMAIGCGQIFGITLPENFKQPFLAKNASEFWRRWHISLGVWFKTYIFYPVSMSNMARNWAKRCKEKGTNQHLSRMVTSAMALLPVWLCNGLWHGPKWTYIFYGVFYFVVIMLELILEPVSDGLLQRLHLEKKSRPVVVLSVLRTWCVIFLGELFFEADSVRQGFGMLGRLFTGFRISGLWQDVFAAGMDGADLVIVLVCLIAVLVVNLLREKGVDIGTCLLQKPAALRWSLALLLVICIMIFGLYGPGYMEVDMIYAGF